jgi:hypothetical protein
MTLKMKKKNWKMTSRLMMMMMKIQIGTDIARQTTRVLVSSVEMVI